MINCRFASNECSQSVSKFKNANKYSEFTAMKIIVICIFLLCLGIQAHAKGCSLPISVSDEKHLPVIVDNSQEDFKLAFPHLGYIELNADDTIILTCPNSGNTLNLTHTDTTLATCVSGETIMVSNQKQYFEDMVCTKSLRGTAQKTDNKCGAGTGYIINIGFPTEGQFLTLINVCYDADNGNTLYTSHMLYGTEINYAASSSYRPDFSSAELAPDVSANVDYKRVSQTKVFSELLGSAELAEQYVNTKSFLTRGHLSPKADFLFASWQFATFFYVNTVPQWQAVNSGNWNKLENLAKQAAAYHDEDWRVYTGGYGIFSLPDVHGVETEIHLSNEKLAVPKFIWKILHSEVSGKAIAFITVNNEFLTELNTSDKLCTDICDQYGWGEDSWISGTKGFIYCCDATDLLEVISTGPVIDIQGILTGPNSSMKFGRFGYRSQGTR